MSAEPERGAAVRYVAGSIASDVEEIRESIRAHAREFACRDAHALAGKIDALAGELARLARMLERSL